MQNKVKDSLSKTILKYSLSKIYRQALGVFTAIIRPKLLTPELYGLWNILILIPTYASYIHLGSRDLMRYLIPYHVSRKDYQKNREIKGTVFSGSLYLNLLIVVVLIIVSFTMGMSLKVRAGLLTMAALVILTWYVEYYLSLLKGYQNFKLITSSNYLKATLTLCLSIVLIYLFGIYGVFLTPILSLTAVILYLRANHPLEPHSASFSFSAFARLVKKGFPIMMFGLITILMITSGRVIVSYFLGNQQLGYYAISTMVVNALMNMPGAARDIMEPKLMADLNDNSNEKNFNEYFFKPLLNTAYYMPFLIGPVIFLLPVLIPLILPRYIPGIVPTQIITFGIYFLSLSYVFRGIIVANGWQLKASLVMAFSLLINISLSIFLVKLGLGIEGVALGGSVSFAVLLVSLLIFVRKWSSFPMQDWRTNIMGLGWPLAVTCSVVSVLEYASKEFSMNDYMAAFIKLSLFFMVMFIVINRARKKHVLLKGIMLKGLWENAKSYKKN